MRNLKKVLSLSLALVMLLGMMVVGAGAATALDVYSDANDITYKEAVDLLTALDVLQGDDGGFRPTDTLTREEAAKIVAYVALGVDAAEALTVTKAPFTDVAATRWSAGYIAYCANVGIINGMGDGTYKPTDTVTGYQMAKMLLCVVGYGVNDEYTGSNWSLNVAKDGVTTGLFSRLQNVGNTPATREEAAQLAFNAITRVQMVAYSSLYGTYSAYTGAYGQQQLLGEKVAKIFNAHSVDTTDGYGYNYHYWTYIGSKTALTDEYLSDVILGTETNAGISLGALYKGYDWNDLGSTTDRLAPNDGNGVELMVNGTNRTALISGNPANNINPDLQMKGSNTKPFETYNGYTATIVDEDGDGDADKVIVVIEYLAEVTKVNAATPAVDRSVNLTVYDSTGKLTVTNVESEDFNVGDYVLVVPSSDTTAGLKEPLAMKAAEVVTGTVSAYYVNAAGKANGSVTTGGVKYAYNGIFAHTTDALGYVLSTSTGASGYSLGKGSYNFYLDSNGNIIGAKVVKNAISDFAYILAVGEDAFQQYNTVKALLSDGTVGTYTVSAQSSAKAYDGANPTDDSLFAAVGQIYGYSLADNNVITLTTLTGDYGAAENLLANTGYTHSGGVSAVANKISSFEKGYSTIIYGTAGTGSTVYATDETVFFYVVGGTVTKFVGKNNAPSIAANADGTFKDATIAYHTVGTSTTKYADVVVVTGAPATTMGSNYMYLLSTTVVGYSTAVNGAPVYYYNVIKGGEKTTIASDALLSTVGVYQYALDEAAFTSDDLNMVESGKYTMALATAVISGYVAVKSNNNVIVLADAAGSQIAYGDIDITDVTGGVETGATIEVGDPVTVVYSTKVAAVNTYVASSIYITGANVAWLTGFNVVATTNAGDINACTEPAPGVFNVTAKTSLTAEQLVAAAVKSAGATVTVHSTLADAQNDVSALSGALTGSTTYYVRVDATVGAQTVYNVFTVNVAAFV